MKVEKRGEGASARERFASWVDREKRGRGHGEGEHHKDRHNRLDQEGVQGSRKPADGQEAVQWRSCGLLKLPPGMMVGGAAAVGSNLASAKRC